VSSGVVLDVYTQEPGVSFMAVILWPERLKGGAKDELGPPSAGNYNTFRILQQTFFSINND